MNKTVGLSLLIGLIPLVLLLVLFQITFHKTAAIKANCSSNLVEQVPPPTIYYHYETRGVPLALYKSIPNFSDEGCPLDVYSSHWQPLAGIADYACIVLTISAATIIVNKAKKKL